MWAGLKRDILGLGVETKTNRHPLENDGSSNILNLCVLESQKMLIG